MSTATPPGSTGAAFDALAVDVYSDLVCPWCWLGKRRFEAALRTRPDVSVRLRWRPFELVPDLPVEGVDRREFLLRKYGAAERFEGTQRRLVQLGLAEGIEYRFDAIARLPNTRRSHVLVALAGARQSEVVERLFAAYFSEGRDLGDPAVLETIGVESGLAAAAVRAALVSAESSAAIAHEERQAHALGVQGVPCFVYAGTWALSGARQSGEFAHALDHVLAEFTRRGGGTDT